MSWAWRSFPDSSSLVALIRRLNEKLPGLGQTIAEGWHIFLKTLDEERVSTTTLADDEALTLQLSAGQLYNLRGRILLSAANATMDFKYDLHYSGTIGEVVWHTRHSAPGATSENVTTGSGTLPGSTAVTAATSGMGWVEFDLSITPTTAGMFSFRWAQNTSDAGVLSVQAGSYIERLVV